MRGKSNIKKSLFNDVFGKKTTRIYQRKGGRSNKDASFKEGGAGSPEGLERQAVGGAGAARESPKQRAGSIRFAGVGKASAEWRNNGSSKAGLLKKSMVSVKIRFCTSGR